MFGNYFSSVHGQDVQYSDNAYNQTCSFPKSDSLSFVQIGNYDLLTRLNKLYVNKGAGPVNISSMYVKRCSEGPVNPLITIINASLSSGIFPSIWKIA